MLYDKSLQAVLEDLSINSENDSVIETKTPSAGLISIEKIKAHILQKNLRPGDPLPTEAQLCQELNVSRTSVREALRRLAALDIVNSHQGKGTFVGEMSLRPLVETLILRCTLQQNQAQIALQQVIETRQALDLGVASELTRILPGKDTQELEELVESMMVKAEAGMLFTDEDYAFHTKLLQFLDNPLFVQLTSAMWLVHMATITEITEVTTADLLQSAKSHQDILLTAKAGDITGYRSAVIAHYEPLVSWISRR